MSVEKRGTLSLSAIEGDLIPEEQTYQAKLRAAMSGGVSEADVNEIVKNITAKAKTGDERALKMFFEYVVGVNKAPTKISINQHFADPEAAARAARAQSIRRKRSCIPADEQ